MVGVKFRPTIVVVYKHKWGSKKKMKIFTNFRNPDPILEDVKGKYIPATAEILDIGVLILIRKNIKFLSELVGILPESSYI